MPLRRARTIWPDTGCPARCRWRCWAAASATWAGGSSTSGWSVWRVCSRGHGSASTAAGRVSPRTAADRARGRDATKGRARPFRSSPIRCGDLSAAQQAANKTQKFVRSAEGMSGSRGRRQRLLLTDARGRRPRWRIDRPEPEASRVESWARMLGRLDAGEPATPAVLEEVRVLLRALKFTFGRDVQDEKDFLDLLRGISALERMWSKDQRAARLGPFMLDTFRHVVAAHPEGRRGVDQAGYRAVLRAARRVVPNTPLTGFVAMPAVEDALQWLQTEGWPGGSHDLVTRVLRTPLGGPAQTARMFWARVRTHELLRRPGVDEAVLTRRILGMEAAADVDDRDRARVRTLLTQAFAEGHDAADSDVAVAYALKRQDLLSLATALSTVGRDDHRGAGRDFTGEVPQPTLDLRQIGTREGRRPAPWLGRSRLGAPRPVPYVVRAKADPAERDHLLLTGQDGTRRVTHGEFMALLALDPALTGAQDPAVGDASLTVDVVLDIPGLEDRAPWLAASLAQHLGRRVWATKARIGLAEAGADATSMLSLDASYTDDMWTEYQPVDPAHPVAAPRAVPDPVPPHAPLPGEEGNRPHAALPADCRRPRHSDGARGGARTRHRGRGPASGSRGRGVPSGSRARLRRRR
ncbi:lonely Cys domain-containing protein [Streptomyces sp. GKU 257-1]|nr:lonely Cys domain-containing protein [Streptomyces sp. GKU 257-1]